MQGFSSRPFDHGSRTRIHNPVVQAPKPVQTCSLKAEYGGSDVILFRTSKKEGSCWGQPVASKPSGDLVDTKVEAIAVSNETEDHNASLIPTTSIFPNNASVDKLLSGLKVADSIDDSNYHSSQADANNHHVREEYNAVPWDDPALHLANSSAEVRDHSGRDMSYDPKVDPRNMLFRSQESHHIVCQDRPSLAVCPQPTIPEQSQTPWTEDREFESSVSGGHQSAVEALHAAVTQSRHPATYHKQEYAFETPPLEETLDEAEKERRRRALAIEQQQMILKRVEAARADKAASRNRKSPRHQQLEIKKNGDSPKSAPLASNKVGPEPINEKPLKRGSPRTKGRLYERRPDGSFVDVDTGVSLLSHREVICDNDRAKKGYNQGSREDSEETGDSTEPRQRPNPWDQGPPNRLFVNGKFTNSETDHPKERDDADEAKDQQVETEPIHRDSTRGPQHHWKKKIPHGSKQRSNVKTGGGGAFRSSAAKIKNQRHVQSGKGNHNKIGNIQDNDSQNKAKLHSRPRRARKHPVAAAIS